jgi:integrase
MTKNAALTDTQIKNASLGKTKGKDGKPAKQLTDGRGLYLKLMPTGAHSWRFDFKSPADGARKTLYLGTYPEVGLADARDLAGAARSRIARKVCPIVAKEADTKTQKEAQALAAAVAKGDAVPGTIRAVATELHASMVAEWSPGYAKKWLSAMNRYVFPAFGDKQMAAIGHVEIRAVFENVRKVGGLHIEDKVRKFVSQVFSEGRLRGLCTLVVADLLAKIPKIPECTPLPSQTTARGIARVLAAIDDSKLDPHRDLLQIMALVWQRPSPVCAMAWSELDLDGGGMDWAAMGLDLDYTGPCWVVPAAKMKGDKYFKTNGKPHIIPLPTQAVEILKRRLAAREDGCAWVFPSRELPYGALTLGAVRNHMNDTLGLKGIFSLHGFRAMARTTLDETFQCREKALEMHLAHSNGLATGVSYSRSIYLEERTGIQQTWANHLDQLRAGNVVQMVKRAA